MLMGAFLRVYFFPQVKLKVRTSIPIHDRLTRPRGSRAELRDKRDHGQQMASASPSLMQSGFRRYFEM